MATQTQEIRNMRLISHHDLNGFGNIGEGVHLHVTGDGRRILYLAHESAPKDITSVDVTDIASPRVVVQTELAYSSPALQLAGHRGRRDARGLPIPEAGAAGNGDGRLRHQQRRGAPAHRFP